MKVSSDDLESASVVAKQIEYRSRGPRPLKNEELPGDLNRLFSRRLFPSRKIDDPFRVDARSDWTAVKDERLEVGTKREKPGKLRCN